MTLHSIRLALSTLVLLAASGVWAEEVDISRGQTSVVLDLETLGSVGLDLSGLSDDVIVPGSLEGSVAFAINPRDAQDPLLATTFSYDPSDFLSTFAGTIEHSGSVLFNDSAVEVGNLTIAFDPARVNESTGASGFFVESTVGVEAPIFDVALDDAIPSDSSLVISGDLLVSAELAGVLGNVDLEGADVGDFLVEAQPNVAVAGGQTSVALDFETLEAVGLVLSGLSDDVIPAGSIEGSVAFAINSRDASPPDLPTTFSYDPDDFLGSFAGTIEHTGSVFFNDDAVEVGNFTVGFDADRIEESTQASGFFVASTVGVEAPIFDVNALELSVSSRETGLTVSGQLQVSPELAGVLQNSALIGALVGTFEIEGSASVTIEVQGGQTNVVLDTETLSSVGLELSGVSSDVIVPGTVADSVAFVINATDAESPDAATTFRYDPTDFLGSFAGTLEHTGSVFFNEGAIEVGDFSIGFDPARINELASGFFVTSTTGLEAPLFDVASADLTVAASDLTLGLAGDLLVSEELAGVLQNEGLTGADIGDFYVEALPEPSHALMGLAALCALAALRQRSRATSGS